jgi:hypothetical protein
MSLYDPHNLAKAFYNNINHISFPFIALEKSGVIPSYFTGI